VPDPGEIRDRETAELAVQAAMTGHLVFTTLHTNDAPGAVVRLTDLGIEPYLTASALRGVMAQRLVRRICGHCRRLMHDAETAPAGEKNLYCGAGCAACKKSGYLGRIGIFELLLVDDGMRPLILQRADAPEIRKYCVARQGMKSMREDGMEKECFLPISKCAPSTAMQGRTRPNQGLSSWLTT